MKGQFVRILTAAGLAMLGSLTLSAQNQGENAKIPFAFHANNTSFTAGEYQVRQVTSSGLFQLMSTKDGNSIFVNAPPLTQANDYVEGHLMFACSGGDCVLSQIWLAGSKIGYIRSDSSVEHDMQRKLGMASMINVKLVAH